MNSAESSSSSSSDDSDVAVSDGGGHNSPNENDNLFDPRRLKNKVREENRKLKAALKAAHTKGCTFDDERLNIEKTILSTISALATRQMLYNFKKMYELKRNNVSRIGTVTLSNIKVDYIYGPNSSNLRRYFLCALTLNENCSLFLSQICEPGPDGIVDFKVKHTFSNLSKDFEIFVNIYVLKVERQNLKRRLKQRAEKLLHPKENVDNDTLHDASLFEFWKRTIISMTNVNTTKEIGVEIVDMQMRKIFADVAGVVDTSSFCCRSWMSVWCHDRVWEYKWCVLRGTQLECFNDLEDQDTSDPAISVDLKLCVEVNICTENQQGNNRILKLTIKGSDLNYEFCMCTSSTYHFTLWEKVKDYIATLKDWREANCLIE